MFSQIFSSKSSVTYSFNNWRRLFVSSYGCSFANFSISTKVMSWIKSVLFFHGGVIFWHILGGSRTLISSSLSLLLLQPTSNSPPASKSLSLCTDCSRTFLVSLSWSLVADAGGRITIYLDLCDIAWSFASVTVVHLGSGVALLE